MKQTSSWIRKEKVLLRNLFKSKLQIRNDKLILHPNFESFQPQMKTKDFKNENFQITHNIHFVKEAVIKKILILLKRKNRGLRTLKVSFPKRTRNSPIYLKIMSKR